MLRMVSRHRNGDAVVLSLEGRIIGPWVEELRRHCAGILATGTPLTLDLTGVAFVERDGVSLLKQLVDDGVGVVNSPAFVVEQLRALCPR